MSLLDSRFFFGRMLPYLCMSFKEKLFQEPSIFLFRKMWEFAGERRRNIVLYAVMYLIANLIILLPPLIFGSFVREIQSNGVGTENLQYLLVLLFCILFAEIGFWLFHGPARVIENFTGFQTEISYRRYLLGGVLDLGLTWHSEHDSGNTIDKVNKAGDGIGKYSKNVFQIIQLIVRLVGTSLVLIWFSPQIAFWVLLSVIASFFVIYQFDKRIVPQYRRLNELANKAMASIFDALSNITSVKILHIEKPILEGISTRLYASQNLYHQNSKLNEAKWFTGAIIFQGIAVIPIGFYIYFGVREGEYIDAGIVSTLYLYLSNLIYVYFGFTGFYEELTICKNQVLNAKPIEDTFLLSRAIRKERTKTWRILSIKDLDFTYDDLGSVQHLSGLNMDIHRGERIAVIGESGSGKTTFLKVLHGLYPSAQGLVGFDNKKTFKTSFADIDLQTMLVPQEPEIFSSTIRENITLGIPYPESDVLHVMRIANFDLVVDALPKSLDSIINEKGVNLSGGQKQRLALSRALLFSKDKDIILLDESTSSVDIENETEIYTNIWKEFSKKTVIASIHKMNLLKMFDRIYIFENGTIIDSGSFDELLAKNASFKANWDQFVATEGKK